MLPKQAQGARSAHGRSTPRTRKSSSTVPENGCGLLRTVSAVVPRSEGETCPMLCSCVRVLGHEGSTSRGCDRPHHTSIPGGAEAIHRAARKAAADHVRQREDIRRSEEGTGRPGEAVLRSTVPRSGGERRGEGEHRVQIHSAKITELRWIVGSSSEVVQDALQEDDWTASAAARRVRDCVGADRSMPELSPSDTPQQ
uniref:(northern house mosquito) hypothetical protein n=1 Tax=Culex pipiens TaxID=7175 RepID=A0A8D8CCK8_CULPI